MSDDPADQPSWPSCLLIEHRGKISKKIQKNPLEYIAIKFDTYM